MQNALYVQRAWPESQRVMLLRGKDGHGQSKAVGRGVLASAALFAGRRREGGSFFSVAVVVLGWGHLG